MSKFETFLDLKIAALQRAGELTNGTSDYDTIVEEQIGNLFRSLYAGSNEFNVDLGEPWEWAKAPSPGVLTLIPPFASGTISLTQDSASATLSTAPTGLGSLKNHYLVIDNRSTVYRISAHTANATALTLDQIYLEDTGATLSFKIIKLDYDLTSGIERLIGPMRCYKAAANDDPTGEISSLDLVAFERRHSRARLKSGAPENFAIVAESNGVMTVRMSHYQYEDKLRVEYDYIPIAPNLITQSYVNADVTTGTDLLTIANHGFVSGQQVKLTTAGTLPTGLALDTVYYIISPTTNTFKISTTLDGLAVDITGTSGAAADIHKISVIPTVPHSHRKTLFYGATHFVMVDKSDSRADYYMRLTQAGLQAVVSASRKSKQHTSKNRGKLIARPEQRAYSQMPQVLD